MARVRRLQTVLALLFLWGVGCSEESSPLGKSTQDMSSQVDQGVRRDLGTVDMAKASDMKRLVDMASQDQGGAQGDMLQVDASTDQDMAVSWRAKFERDSYEMQTMQALSVKLDIEGVDASMLSSQWKVGSLTAQGVMCGQLIREQKEAEVVLLLKGDEDARCADEVRVSVMLTQGGQAQELAVDVKVIPSGQRVFDFKLEPGNPQPVRQVCPTWECLNHTDPTMGRLPSGELAVWFAAGGDANGGLPFPVVGRAVQKAQQGWTLDDGPLMVGTDALPSNWDKARETPSVKWNAGANAWDMWYLGYNEGYFKDPGLGQAQSKDPEGVMWERSKAPIYRPTPGAWDESFLTSPGALRGSDGVWRLYFSGASVNTDAIMRVGMLTSTDGKSWTPYASNPVFEGPAGEWDSNVLDPHVQFVGGRYVMWYSALAGQLRDESTISIGVATSEDGYVWKREGTTPIIGPVAASWGEARIAAVEVLPQESGELLMTGYGLSKIDPAQPTFRPGNIGFWKAELPSKN